jgi:hypothetical protein
MIIMGEVSLMEKFNRHVKDVQAAVKPLETQIVQLEFKTEDKTGKPVCEVGFWKGSDVDLKKLPRKVGVFKIKPVFGSNMAIA